MNRVGNHPFKKCQNNNNKYSEGNDSGKKHQHKFHPHNRVDNQVGFYFTKILFFCFIFGKRCIFAHMFIKGAKWLLFVLVCLIIFMIMYDCFALGKKFSTSITERLASLITNNILVKTIIIAILITVGYLLYILLFGSSMF